MRREFIIATIDGRFEEASEILERRRALYGEVWPERHGGEFGLIRLLVYLGKGIDEYYKITTFDGAERPNYQQGILCLAHLGRKDEVATMLKQAVLDRPGIGLTEDETPLSIDIALLQAAILTEHREAAELLLNRLAGSGFCTSGQFETTCVDRHLGGAAALLGRPEEARKYYADAIEVATNMRFRPELALTRLQLAELLLEHYPDEKPEALEHLDFAINEFREMKMQPSLERALRHKEILDA
jgi:tetratricopeptide (TPR) repeat protein